MPLYAFDPILRHSYAAGGAGTGGLRACQLLVRCGDMGRWVVVPLRCDRAAGARYKAHSYAADAWLCQPVAGWFE
jgi:hypothetical protein